MRYGTRPTNPGEWVALKLGKVPVPILDVIIGPLQGRALIAAERAGLFAALAEKPGSADELAARAKLDPECTRLVLRLVRAMGYVELNGDSFSLSPSGEAHFGKEGREPYRAFLEYGEPQWRMIERLDEVLKTGLGIDFHEHQTPEEWDAYQRAMLENARGFSWFVADNLPVRAGAERCLDVAGAHGLVGAELCRKHPGLKSVVLDRAEALPRARALSAAAGQGELVSFREGDLLKDDYGEGQDVVLLCNILHHFSAAQNVEILKRARKSMRPGATVGIFDIETPADSAPADAAGDAFALYFRITSTSTCFRGDDYLGWLTEAGFSEVRAQRSLRMPSRVLAIGVQR